MTDLKDMTAQTVAALRQSTYAPYATTPDLPPCPICSAPALARSQHRSWHDLEHDCLCVMESESRYLAGLRELWKRKNALPQFLDSLPARYRDYRADQLQRTAENAPVIEYLAGCRETGLAENLYLWGEAGTGKTHLAVSAAYRAAKLGRSTRFWGMTSLIQAIKASFDHDGPARPVLDFWDVLVLDDIDKLNPTQFVYETLYTVIEQRWADGKVTIFTAQTDPEAAAYFLTPVSTLPREAGQPEPRARAADPLASRMSSGRVFEVSGIDRRAM